MRIIADTNILVRVALRDDERQANLADALLEEAEVVAIPSIALCEFLWILQRLHRFTRAEIEAALDTLLRAANVRVNRPAVEAGLAVYRAGATSQTA